MAEEADALFIYFLKESISVFIHSLIAHKKMFCGVPSLIPEVM